MPYQFRMNTFKEKWRGTLIYYCEYCHTFQKEGNNIHREAYCVLDKLEW